MFDAIKNAVDTVKNNIFGGSEQAPVYDDDLVAFVDKEFKRRQEERRTFELQWRLNLAFYEGNQFLDINTASMSLEEQPILFDFQEREVFNQIAPNIETRISKLKRVRTVLKVRPGTTEQEDVHSAKVGTHLLKNNYNDQRLQDKQAEELVWMEICGTVFRKHIWNPQIGRVIGTLVTVDPETGEQAVEEVREGDWETIVVPPQELYPDSSYRNDISQCKSVIHAKAFDIDDILDIWGVEVSPEKAESEQMTRIMNGLGGLGYGQGSFMVHTVKLEHHAIVKEYSEMPSKKYPQGRFIIVAGGKLLHAGPLPFMVGEDGKPGLPFAMLVCIKRPGIFWGKTVLERLIPLQRRYNALRNRKAEYLNRCAIGQWIVEDGAVDLDVFEQDASAPGEVHVVQKGFRYPTMVQSPPLPANFETEQQNLLNEFAILSGVSEISRQSNAPPGVKSGVALAIVQEQDDTRLSNTIENIERFNIQSGKIQLRLAKQFVKAPRTLYAIGRNNVAEVIDWMGSTLKSEDVVLDNISALSESPAQNRQMVFDLLESGLLNDPDTGRISKEKQSKIFEMIELFDWESADDTEQLHLAKAERENRDMQQGRFPGVAYYDEHIMHISRHNKFRLTTDYEELKAQNPQIEKIFDAHVQLHMLPLQQQAMAEAAARQQQMAGGGGEVA